MRPGCDRPAAARLTYDTDAAAVWLDRPVEDGQPAQQVCSVHAATLTAPLGWTVTDRRLLAVGSPEPGAERSGRSPGDWATQPPARSTEEQPARVSAASSPGSLSPVTSSPEPAAQRSVPSTGSPVVGEPVSPFRSDRQQEPDVDPDMQPAARASEPCESDAAVVVARPGVPMAGVSGKTSGGDHRRAPLSDPDSADHDRAGHGSADHGSADHDTPDRDRAGHDESAERSDEPGRNRKTTGVEPGERDDRPSRSRSPGRKDPDGRTAKTGSRGKLLDRAFEWTGPQHSVLTTGHDHRPRRRD